MNETKRKILKFCIDKKRDIIASEIAQVLNLSQNTVQKYLRDFQKAGRIAQFVKGQYQLMDPKHYFDNYLFVYKKEQLIGYLNFDKGLYQFAYENHYLCQLEAIALSPTIELTETILKNEIFPVFEQLIPEGTDRKLLERKAGSANDFDLLPLLQHIYGDFQFSKTPLNLKDKHYSHQIFYEDIKSKLLEQNAFPNILEMDIQIDNEVLFPERKELDKVSRIFPPSGLSGYQHKFSVVLKNNIIRQAKENESAYYFIKPYHPEKANKESNLYFPHLAINEHLFMTFAKNELKFDVPWTGIVKRQEDEEYHYIVKRFDRYNGYKFAYYEFATLLGLDSERKYEISSEKMLKRIKEVLILPKERLILLSYYFYSMLIVHEDMHTKNLSVRTEGEEIRMSPLYDIATTAIYQNIYGYESHLPINGKRTNIRPKDFYVLVDLMQVNRKTFTKTASFILSCYINKLPEYFDKLEKFLPDVLFYKRKLTRSFNRNKQRVVKSMSLADKMKQNHQIHMKQLKKNGWYTELKINCSVK
ncbi:HipA domain-containing protein [Candidatus Parabeggiatoa sp. HSG14]|uniref:HipA domain-containing protein n=1 Tax=Candidatus Parabeggiatoa sp. HSG14 TaxID=3055593 RepID=UPI0025A8EBC2|nr:HipA domain-containing protein [Thiotrichales bacterium HSG14]